VEDATGIAMRHGRHKLLRNSHTVVINSQFPPSKVELLGMHPLNRGEVSDNMKQWRLTRYYYGRLSGEIGETSPEVKRKS